MANELTTKDLPDFTRENAEGELERDGHMDNTFRTMCERASLKVPRTKEFKRQEVVDAFRHSFELIGGVPRLAAWAHHNPTEFFKLYGKLLPSQSIHEMGGESGVLRIIHSIAPGPLDTAPEAMRDKERIIEHADETDK